MAPMNQQHRVSAAFDECRGNRDHFHNGTDIPLAPGGNVLNSEAADVLYIYPQTENAYIRVGRFAYIHVDPDPALEVGDEVALGELVGHTNSQAHVHLKEGGGGSGAPVLNSLRDNALTPFEDTYGQHVYSIDYYMDGPGQRFDGNEVFGPVDIVVRAGDTTDTESSIDMNNGVYKIGYRIFENDQVTPVTSLQMSYTFDHLFSSSIINRVYAAGSNTSTYRYIVTNTENSDRFWDTTELEPGDYSIAIYTFDTKFNSDTTFFPVIVTEQDTDAPAPPELQYVGQRGDSLAIEWHPNTEPDLQGYRLYYSYNGTGWNLARDEDDLGPETTSLYIPGFESGTTIFFYLTALDNAPLPNISTPSDIYGTRLSPSPEVLLIDGFDRSDGMWQQASHPFGMAYGKILDSLGVAFRSATDDFVAEAGISLAEYPAVVWFTGDDMRGDTVFSNLTQQKVKSYLESGGRIFVSGAHIASALDLFGSPDDSEFLSNYLKIAYQSALTEFSGIHGFQGTLMEPVSGSISTEEFPLDSIDIFEVRIEAGEILGTEDNKILGAYYNGPFGGNSVDGKVAITSVPLMTIVPAVERSNMLDAVLRDFGVVTHISEDEPDEILPHSALVSPAYPNPFNPTVKVAVTSDEAINVHYTVYDVAGRVVYAADPFPMNAGRKILTWDGSERASGIYFLRVRVYDQNSGALLTNQTNKLLLLR